VVPKGNAANCSKNRRGQDFTLTDSGLQQSTQASDDGQQFYIKYQMQFRSALPVRQAVVRQMQIAQKYDSLLPSRSSSSTRAQKSFSRRTTPTPLSYT